MFFFTEAFTIAVSTLQADVTVTILNGYSVYLRVFSIFVPKTFVLCTLGFCYHHLNSSFRSLQLFTVYLNFMPCQVTCLFGSGSCLLRLAERRSLNPIFSISVCILFMPECVKH